MTKAHRTQTVRVSNPTDGSKAYASLCSCGWVGDDYPDRETAVDDASSHKITELRNNQKAAKDALLAKKDPSQLSILGSEKTPKSVK